MSFVAHLWQSTLCVAVATLLAVWFRRAPARLRYRIWIAAAAKFLVPFSALVAAGRIAGESTMPATPLPAAFHWLQRSFSALAAVPGATVEHSLSPRFLASIGMAWLTGACAVAAWRWLAWHHIGGIARTASVLRDGREVRRPATSASPRDTKQEHRTTVLTRQGRACRAGYRPGEGVVARSADVKAQ